MNIDPTVWLMLYGNASALQIGLYIWNRRHNVSARAGGIRRCGGHGHVRAVRAALREGAGRRRPAPQEQFVVTPKGDSASPDRWFATFRYHWYFILIFGASITAGFVFGHSHPAMIIWATFATLVTATPIFAWRHQLRQARKKPAVPQQEPQTVPITSPRLPRAPTRRSRCPRAGAAGAQHAPHAPHVPHAPQQKPSWATSNGTGDQTMQIALGGLGGRKE
ncbi:cellulose synthase (UDP-forming) OS=Streptomyces alboniger OX=132473 GN=CP975_12790 PE=4 SV=1 [Streptomyces alboniger]